jgi:hypothetical protein
LSHSTKPLSAETLEALREYAETDNERTCLEALIECGSRRKAAKAIGKNDGSFNSAINCIRRRAASRGWAPEHGWNPPAPRTAAKGTVPEGFRLKGVSDKVDAQGERVEAWIKSERGTDPEAHAKPPPDHVVTGTSTYVDGQGNVRGQWVTTRKGEADRWEAMIKAARDACSEMSGARGAATAPADTDADTMAVYGFGDPHIGMLSWAQETGQDFDIQIAQERTTAVVRRLVASAPSSAIGLLILVGDNYHADSDAQLTPGHGHKLDVDTRAAKIFRVGCSLWRAAIDCMREKHETVRVVVVRGNHDPLTSFFLCEWLRAIYSQDPRVEILDNVREHQYILFGKVLLGFCHGEKTKPEGLAGVMAADVPDMWAQATAERHWLTGHVHSKHWWDFRGCSLETLRTLAPEDAYANRAGYRSRQDSVVITYHKDFGEIARATVSLARAGVAPVKAA